MKYLSAKPLPVPEAVTASPEAEVAEDEGFVAPGFHRGALIFEDGDGKFFRLSWEDEDAKVDPDADRRRTLPAGRYTLRGYRIVEEDKRGVAWHLSATAKSMGTFLIEAGSTRKVKPDPTIHMGTGVRRGRIAVSIQGDEHAGLSIYKAGKRIAIGYRLFSGDEEVATGTLDYG